MFPLFHKFPKPPYSEQGAILVPPILVTMHFQLLLIRGDGLHQAHFLDKLCRIQPHAGFSESEMGAIFQKLKKCNKRQRNRQRMSLKKNTFI